jgi:hypothetical protein
MAKKKRDFKRVSAKDAQHIFQSKLEDALSKPKKIAEETEKARLRAMAAWIE